MHTPSTASPASELRQLAGLILEFCDSSDTDLGEVVTPHGLSAKEIKAATAGKYDDDAAASMLEAVKAAAASINGQGSEPDPLYEDMSTTKAVRAAYTRLRLSGTKAKLVIIEGQTGMGKTSSGEIIATKTRDLNPTASIHSIEATSAWKGRPGPMMAAMLRALGMPDNSRSGAAKLEKLVEALNQRPTTFIIDEIHDGGVDMLRMLKTLLNRSSVKVVLLAHPRLFRDLENEAWDDVRQLTGNRLLARIDLGRVTEADATMMLTKRVPSLNGDTKQAAVTLAKAAHGNGNFALIREIIVRLQRHATRNKAKALTMQDVEKALREELRDRKALSLSH
ncbi:MAG: ATP-binding protein [Verrucomicrobiota bacterium]